MKLTNKQKADALIAWGECADYEAALAFLVDCGEYDAGDSSLDGHIDEDAYDRITG